jgi:hypothetical protein
MTRRPDWKRRLIAWLDAQRQVPFAWGTSDCCLFVAGGIAATTGEDPAAAWRGTYGDAEGAERIVAGWGSLPAFVTAQLGEPHAATRLARQGDVGFAADTGRECLGPPGDAGPGLQGRPRGGLPAGLADDRGLAGGQGLAPWVRPPARRSWARR